MQKEHPDLPVRWLPVAYIRKNSATLASLLINSRHPRRDLDTDLGEYDFEHGHGGIQSGHGDHASLPQAQKTLMEGVTT